ncbi:winged helix-turn-helix domain-containing protein [Patescibacteria group bacterium]|nr:winged helix-turn-helix domain-containing protein [Patescibacteria group bacterium]
MLEQIFSSVARTKILKFFCVHYQEKFFVRELARRLGVQLNSIRRELDNLENFGFLHSENEGGKKYYYANTDFPLFSEIKNLVFKSLALEEMNVAGKMSKVPGLKLLVFTGILTESPAATDVLIVGKVNKTQFDKYLGKIAEGLPAELRYTFLSLSDYLYRIEITDKFIYDIWAHNKIIVVDKISDKLKKNIWDDFNFKHFKGD